MRAACACLPPRMEARSISSEQTFLAVFAVEELAASLTLLGYCTTANQVCGLIM